VPSGDMRPMSRWLFEVREYSSRLRCRAMSCTPQISSAHRSSTFTPTLSTRLLDDDEDVGGSVRRCDEVDAVEHQIGTQSSAEAEVSSLTV
jgi:hypothetical protein